MEQALQQHRTDDGRQLADARILIVEDEPAVAHLLEAAVNEAGGQVLAVVPTVEEALSCISAEDISAVIVTLIADGTYTDEVARELFRRDVPFVVTTGIGADRSHPELHAALSITKPFQASYVQTVLADLIAGREYNRPAGRAPRLSQR